MLRPSEVDVRVQSTTSGAVVRQERMTADYRALGPRQTNCGGDAQGMQFVPGG